MRRICNLTGTDSRAPSVFIGCTSCFLGIFSSFLVNDLLAFFILLINRGYRDVAADIGCIFISILLQLFHDDNVVVILTISNFDEAVVGSRVVFIFRNCRFLTVIIERKVSIFQRFILIFCDFLIFGIIVFPIFFSCFLRPGGGVVYIALVMAEGNCTFLIGRSLIADSRAIIYCDGRFVASC